MRRWWICLIAALLLVGTAAAEEYTWICPSGHAANHHFCSWCGAARETGTQADIVSAPNNLQLGQTLHLDGIGDVTPLSCTYYNKLYSHKWEHKVAKNEQYLLFEVDILNTNRQAREYLPRAEMKVFYDGYYTYQGEVQQLNDTDTNYCNSTEAELKPLYNSSYAFACKLPNAVINGDGPLTLILTLDGVQLTYDVR